MTVLELMADLKEMPENATVLTEHNEEIECVVVGSTYRYDRYDDSVVFLET